MGQLCLLVMLAKGKPCDLPRECQGDGPVRAVCDRAVWGKAWYKSLVVVGPYCLFFVNLNSLSLWKSSNDVMGKDSCHSFELF